MGKAPRHWIGVKCICNFNHTPDDIPIHAITLIMFARGSRSPRLEFEIYRSSANLRACSGIGTFAVRRGSGSGGPETTLSGSTPAQTGSA